MNMMLIINSHVCNDTQYEKKYHVPVFEEFFVCFPKSLKSCKTSVLLSKRQKAITSSAMLINCSGEKVLYQEKGLKWIIIM